MDDSNAAASVEWGGMMERQVEELREIERDLEDMLRKCGLGFQDYFECLLTSRKPNRQDFCPFVQRIVWGTKPSAGTAPSPGGNDNDVQAGNSTRDETGAGSPAP